MPLPRALARLRWPSFLAPFVLGSALGAQGQDGFLHGAGHSDFALSYTFDAFDEFFDGDDRTSSAAVGEVERRAYALYTAMGLREDLDFVLNAVYAATESDGTSGVPDEEDLQDLTLGLKWRAFEHPIGGALTSFLLAPGVKLPAGNYENDGFSAIGDGQVDLRMRAIAQLQVRGCWIALESGYDIRNGAPHDEVPLNVTLGLTLSERLSILPFWSQVESLGGIDLNEVPARGNFKDLEQDYSQVGVSGYFGLSESVYLSGMLRTTVDGSNVGDSEAFSVGLVVRF